MLEGCCLELSACLQTAITLLDIVKANVTTVSAGHFVKASFLDSTVTAVRRPLSFWLFFQAISPKLAVLATMIKFR